MFIVSAVILEFQFKNVGVVSFITLYSKMNGLRLAMSTFFVRLVWLSGSFQATWWFKTQASFISVFNFKLKIPFIFRTLQFKKIRRVHKILSFKTFTLTVLTHFHLCFSCTHNNVIMYVCFDLFYHKLYEQERRFSFQTCISCILCSLQRPDVAVRVSIV